MELGLFDQVADGLRAMVDPRLGDLRCAPRRWGIKAWFDLDECPREHYEAQLVGVRHVPEAELLALEVGFHAEQPKPQDNEAAFEPLRRKEAGRDGWRRALGDEAVLGPFIGRKGWLRLSEVWIDPDLSDPELCFELADRLATYLNVVEPLRWPD